jgi:hypothetical protein
MTPADETTSRRGLIAGLSLGVPVMAYAVRGALVDARDTHPAELARWIVGLAALHDLVVVPIVLALGAILRRRVSGQAWPAVRVALLASAVLIAVGWPLVRGYGRDPTIPSLLPRNYATGLAVALGAVWLLAAAWVLVRLLRRRDHT